MMKMYYYDVLRVDLNHILTAKIRWLLKEMRFSQEKFNESQAILHRSQRKRFRCLSGPIAQSMYNQLSPMTTQDGELSPAGIQRYKQIYSNSPGYIVSQEIELTRRYHRTEALGTLQPADWGHKPVDKLCELMRPHCQNVVICSNHEIESFAFCRTTQPESFYYLFHRKEQINISDDEPVANVNRVMYIVKGDSDLFQPIVNASIRRKIERVRNPDLVVQPTAPGGRPRNVEKNGYCPHGAVRIGHSKRRWSQDPTISRLQWHQLLEDKLEEMEEGEEARNPLIRSIFFYSVLMGIGGDNSMETDDDNGDDESGAEESEAPYV